MWRDASDEVELFGSDWIKINVFWPFAFSGWKSRVELLRQSESEVAENSSAEKGFDKKRTASKELTQLFLTHPFLVGSSITSNMRQLSISQTHSAFTLSKIIQADLERRYLRQNIASTRIWTHNLLTLYFLALDVSHQQSYCASLRVATIDNNSCFHTNWGQLI